MIDYPIIMKKSLISGMGVFSTRLIKMGERICFMEGREMNINEAIKRIKKGTQNNGDLLQIDNNMYMRMMELNRCVNHSCNPNSFIRGKNELITLKDILKEEEITYDYSTTMWEDKEELKNNFDEDVWTMNCSCGSQNCRKVIDQFYLLPNKLQKFYLENKFVPDFILKNHSKIKNNIQSK